MIKWANGSDTGLPKFRFPDSVRLYEIELNDFGDGLWAVGIHKMPYFSIVRDHFRTQAEAFDFVVSVVTLLQLKYPNAVCNNFSFLPKEQYK